MAKKKTAPKKSKKAPKKTTAQLKVIRKRAAKKAAATRKRHHAARVRAGKKGAAARKRKGRKHGPKGMVPKKARRNPTAKRGKAKKGGARRKSRKSTRPAVKQHRAYRGRKQSYAGAAARAHTHSLEGRVDRLETRVETTQQAVMKLGQEVRHHGLGSGTRGHSLPGRAPAYPVLNIRALGAPAKANPTRRRKAKRGKRR